jgi:type IV secretory pathway TrbF-like protein
VNWYTIAGVVGVLLAAGVGIWYKFKSDAATGAALVTAQDAQKRADAAADAAEKQIEAKNDDERATLNAQVKDIRKLPKDSQLGAALDLLSKLRGVH